jgi:antitoxin HicB
MHVLRYPVAIRELDQSEGGGFLAEIPDLPGCMADGETIEEAVRNVNDAAVEWIAEAKKLGRQVPEPGHSYSGKWVQRVPKSLHQRLAAEARREGVSLNALTTALLVEGIAGKQTYSPPQRSRVRTVEKREQERKVA